ncbi:MAG TPA: heme biosynthesis operon protein HemX, partial [Pseudomonas sp.]|nr:heme biosynthesis operon protein HemX [Pseudomonas sp.]
MSEADSKKEPLQPPASEPTPAVDPVKPAKPAPSRPASSGGGKSLAALALLVG